MVHIGSGDDDRSIKCTVFTDANLYDEDLLEVTYQYDIDALVNSLSVLFPDYNLETELNGVYYNVHVRNCDIVFYFSEDRNTEDKVGFLSPGYRVSEDLSRIDEKSSYPDEETYRFYVEQYRNEGDFENTVIYELSVSSYSLSLIVSNGFSRYRFWSEYGVDGLSLQLEISSRNTATDQWQPKTFLDGVDQILEFFRPAFEFRDNHQRVEGIDVLDRHSQSDLRLLELCGDDIGLFLLIDKLRDIYEIFVSLNSDEVGFLIDRLKEDNRMDHLNLLLNLLLPTYR